MIVLRCTAKVLKLLGQRPRQVRLLQDNPGLDEWYADIVEGLDEPFFLCTNPHTLYTLVLSAGQLGAADLADMLLRRLIIHMMDLGIGRPRVTDLAQRWNSVLVAKTASRSVLGSMNDLITHFYWHFSQQMGDEGKVDIRDIERRLNNMPQRPIGWQLAQERFVESCSQP